MLRFAFFLQQNTPLHLVAKEGYLNAVRYIVDKGADVNVRNHCGVSAYDHPVTVVYIYSDSKVLNCCAV